MSDLRGSNQSNRVLKSIQFNEDVHLNNDCTELRISRNVDLYI